MDTNRKIAISVGMLFIIGTVAGVLSVAFTSPLLDAPDYLMKVHTNENQIIVGALFVLVMGFALAMVPVLMFPIFKKYNEALALGYVVFRGGLETVTYILTAICWLLLLPLGQEYAKSGRLDTASFQTFGILLREVAYLPMTVFVFGLGAMIFYYLLYRSNLIPRWLSVWGFIAIILHLATGLLLVFGLQTENSMWNTLMNFPIFLQEMVMAVWLIVKGFSPSMVISGPARAYGAAG